MLVFFQQIASSIFGRREGFTHDLKSRASNQDGYFDIVIGNPPYLKEGRVSKTIFEGLKHSPYYQGKMDLWYMFTCVGIDLLSKNGTLCFIATNNWVTSGGASKLRSKVVGDSKIIQLVDFGNFMIFESASIQTMIMLFSKNNSIDNYTFDYRKLSGNTILADTLDLLSKKANNEAIYLSPIIIRGNFKDSYLTFNSNDSILEKISSAAFFFSEKEMAQGIVFPQDFLNNKNHKILGGNYAVGESIFGLTNQKKDELDLSDTELNLVKPYYTTEQIHRYYSNPNNSLWLIYTDSKFKNPNSMNNYLNLKKHLDRFSNVITSDNRPYGLHRAREERFFKGEKILALRKCVGTPSFSYSDFDCYVSATFYVIKTDRVNLKYLTGLLNSRLISFWLKNKGKMQGDNYQLDKEPLLQVPIRIGSESQVKLVIELVEQIISSKQIDTNADTYNIEKEIDKIVYDIYELTKEEVRIVT
ncbi:MAG: Eco57I restriction-modification methylase domain-containing protein [Paludibacter sp.]|nr:Eco57I restriction-modification methylase domain-containing protein [Paludibacter sp.]